MAQGPAQVINRYKADLRDIQFVLFEQLRIGEILGKAPFENWGVDEFKMVLEETYRYVCEFTGPYNAIGDQGCTLVNGEVKTPPGFKQAWAKLYEAGWKLLDVDEEFGGQGAPRVLQAQVEEFLSGSNTSFAMYPGLTHGAAELIAHFGTDEQKKRYALRMFNGQWGGTMCLTEPHAGSDVGAATTSAKRNPDGTFQIKGTKIYISAGDHDLAENVVHMVLARIEGALPGTKGLSLFVVPKLRTDKDGKLLGANDVKVAAIEHKMGINGSATCVMQFGEDDGCIGELCGVAENQGMSQMFLMMNGARIGVAIQGLAIGAAAYHSALDYAKERKQGSSVTKWKDPTAPRVSIIEHPDVRRMLLDMKARTEGIRALIMKLAQHYDRSNALKGVDDEGARYHMGQVELLTPIAKAYASDQAFRIAETAIQTYGGAGFTKDYPVEQYCRDSKIFSIYEGTNHIQALDLVGRKLGQAGGRHTQEFLGDIAKFIAANKNHPELGTSVANLEKAHEAVAGTAMQFLSWFQGGQMERVPLAANMFLEMMSELAVGYLLLDAAVIALEKLPAVAEGHPDKAFYTGKRYAATYFANNVLPNVTSKAKILLGGDRSALDIPEDAFSAA